MFPSSAHQGAANQTTERYHFLPTELATSKGCQVLARMRTPLNARQSTAAAWVKWFKTDTQVRYRWPAASKWTHKLDLCLVLHLEKVVDHAIDPG